MELTRGDEDGEQIRGQIILSMMTRDGRGMGGAHSTVSDPNSHLASPDDLPEVRSVNIIGLLELSHISKLLVTKEKSF